MPSTPFWYGCFDRSTCPRPVAQAGSIFFSREQIECKGTNNGQRITKLLSRFWHRTGMGKTHFSQLHIKNLGRFSEAVIQLSPFTLLVGPNDSGKTTVVRALQLISGNELPSIEDFRRDETAPGGRASSLAIEVVVENPPEGLARNLDLLIGDKSAFKLVWTLTTENGEAKVSRPVHLVQRRVPARAELRTWPTVAEEQKAILGQLGITPAANATDRKRQWESARAEAINDPHQTVLDWAAGGRELFLKFAPRLESIAPGDLEDPGALLEKQVVLRARDIIYPPNEEGERSRPDELRALEEVATAKLNLALEELVALMQRHLPGLSGIKVEPEWDLVSGSNFSEVEIEQNGMLLPLSELGGGSSARSALAILEWGTAGGPDGGMRVRAMDEPDHHLHFDAQRRLITLLRKDVEDPSSALAQCVVATHSLVMVDSTPLDEVVYLPLRLEPDKVLAPMLTRTEAEAGNILGNILVGLGLPASWTYLEKALIIVEGSSDLNYVRELYHRTVRHTMVEDGVRVWDAEGCGNIGHAAKLLEEKGRARVFVALDSDAKMHPAPANSNVGSLGEFLEILVGPSHSSNRITWLGRKEVEDTWDPNALAIIADREWPKADGTQWSSRDFESVQTSEKPSHEIEVVIRRGCAGNLQGRRPATKGQIAAFYAQLTDAPHPAGLVAMLRAVCDHCHRDS